MQNRMFVCQCMFILGLHSFEIRELFMVLMNNVWKIYWSRILTNELHQERFKLAPLNMGGADGAYLSTWNHTVLHTTRAFSYPVSAGSSPAAESASHCAVR
jgi:hypothetical protein